MRRLYLYAGGLTALLLIACGAQVAGLVPPPPRPSDAGSEPRDGREPMTEDASGESERPERCEVPENLPVVEYTQNACTTRDGTDCVYDGWFCLSKWTPFYYDGVRFLTLLRTRGQREPRQIVWSHRFLLDRYPVSNAQYVAYVTATNALPPPDRLQYSFGNSDNPDAKREGQPTGWVNGQPNKRRLDHPVVGISRTEAQAYCTTKGGRLPAAMEVMRAGQSGDTISYRYPWGAAFPFRPEGELYPAFGFSRQPLPNEFPKTSSIDIMYGDRSTAGTIGLSSNVGEWLATCEEDIRAEYLENTPHIDEQRLFKARCTSAVLTTDFAQGNRSFDGQAIRSITVENEKAEVHYLGRRMGNPASAFDERRAFYEAPGATGSRDPAGNDVRNFLVGFRCAYEAP
jgi:formylglycine-generating enzyme required for sulfatase activity